MEVKDKIEKLILALGISAARFAEEIDVSRPVISHILSSRNKASLEIIQKIVNRFPELGYDWIADDQGFDYEILNQLAQSLKKFGQKDNLLNSRDFNISNNSYTSSEIFNSHEEMKKSKKAVKVIIFFEDGTFQNFDPSAL